MMGSSYGGNGYGMSSGYGVDGKWHIVLRHCRSFFFFNDIVLNSGNMMGSSYGSSYVTTPAYGGYGNMGSGYGSSAGYGNMMSSSYGSSYVTTPSYGNLGYGSKGSITSYNILLTISKNERLLKVT